MEYTMMQLQTTIVKLTVIDAIFITTKSLPYRGFELKTSNIPKFNALAKGGSWVTFTAMWTLILSKLNLLVHEDLLSNIINKKHNKKAKKNVRCRRELLLAIITINVIFISLITIISITKKYIAKVIMTWCVNDFN